MIAMKKEEVPQDTAILGPWRELFYAVDDNGRYVLAPSTGWDPANMANLQAWKAIAEEMKQALAAVRDGRTSPLAFHMARCQMDVKLLARYVGLSRWRVKRHLRPENYARLQPVLRQRYAQIFRVAPEDLDRLPKQHPLPLPPLAEKE